MDKAKNEQTTGSIFDSKLVGREFGKYRTEKLISKHEFRQTLTLLATNKETNQQVILKAFGSFSAKSKKEFEKEVAVFKILESNHGVLLPLEIFDYEGDYFIVTEYKNGGDLRKWLKTKPKIAETLEIFSRIAEGIDYLHQNKIIHRDIKPENVLYEVLGERITPYLTDFGISVTLPDKTSSFKTEHAFGTIEYMAPEFFLDMNGKKTKAVDIYAFGLMLYEALEGRHPFHRITQQETRDQIVAGILPRPENTAKKLGPNASFILNKALSRNPEDRPKTATEIIEQMGSHYVKYVGKTFGKYIIEEYLGQGSYGSTYKAYELTRKNKKVALKLLAVPQASMPDFSEQKALEYDRGILRIIDAGNENGVQYLISEYLEGDNLRYIFSIKNMEIRDILEILKPVSKTLDYLHKKNTIHRNLKPENILFHKDSGTGDHQIFINDCGVSKSSEAIYAVNANGNAFLPELKYLAPEILEDKEPSPATDVYSLGVIIYEAIEGQTPFDAKSLPSLIKQKLDDYIPVPENLLNKAGIRAARVLLKALNVKPENRQHSVSGLISQLEDAIKDRTFVGQEVFSQYWAKSRRLISEIKKIPNTLWMFGFLLFIMFWGISVLLPTLKTPISIATSTNPPAIPLPYNSTAGATILPVSSTVAPSPTIVVSDECTLPTNPLDQEYLAPRYLLLKEVYIELFRRSPDFNDLYAITYFNNRKILEGHQYHYIDPSSLDIDKGWKIIIPSQDWITEYKKFPAAIPIPLLAQTGTRSELEISGSSVLSHLSAQISKCSTKTAGVELIEINSGNTVSGLQDLCQGKVDLFGANEEIDERMMAEYYCSDIELEKFEVARYAMVVLINKNNPNADDMQNQPLTDLELTNLLVEANLWNEVRGGWSNNEPIVRFYPSLESGQFEIVRDNIFPNRTMMNTLSLNIHNDSQVLIGGVAENVNAVAIVDYDSYRSFENKTLLIAIPIHGFYVNSAIDDPNSRYPLMTPLYLYSEKYAYENNETLRNFVNYYLSHELDFLEDFGYLYPSKQGYRGNRDTVP